MLFLIALYLHGSFIQLLFDERLYYYYRTTTILIDILLISINKFIV